MTATSPDHRIAGLPAVHIPAHRRRHLHRTKAAWFAVWPGLLLTGTIAAAAFALREIPGVATFSPMILAIVIGMAFHNLIGTPARAKAGVTFSLRRILRFAIILLGLQLTAQQVAEVTRLLAQRKATQPTTKRTFGSVFKNPEHELGAGRMIEECGLKGHRIGGALIYALTALAPASC